MIAQDPRRSTLARRITGITVAVAALAALYVFDPATTAFFPSCPLRAWTGWSCPGCGTLRALHALLHGSPLAALRANALATVAAFALTLAWLHDRVAPGALPWLTRLHDTPLVATHVAVAIAFGGLRNVPMIPFSWFTP